MRSEGMGIMEFSVIFVMLVMLFVFDMILYSIMCRIEGRIIDLAKEQRE